MPFAMTHLHIAYNIIMSTPQIRKPDDFLLGSIAPDAVHFRDNYNSTMKFTSHLCVGCEGWGSITNNDEWQNNVVSFLKKHQNTEEADFLFGYCSHILTDIQNNIKIWTPFKHKIAKEKQQGKNYHQESFLIDYELYLQPEQRAMWQLLEKSKACDIPGLINKNEIQLMKESVMNDQYLNRRSGDLSELKHVTLSKMKDFISTESSYLKMMLYGSLTS